MLGTYSLIVALFLGTMGLPHVLVRFYTNPDGRAARRTTVLVLALLGVFYLLPVLLGALSRLYVPQLLVTGETDAAVLLLPSSALGGWGGVALGALVAAGAFAAFLSTASGLVLTTAGVLSTDLLPRRIGDFRIAAHVAGIVPMLVALAALRLDFSEMVSLAFVVAASTFCPLLVLGIWWRGLTDRGAIAGMLVGGGTGDGVRAGHDLRRGPGGCARRGPRPARDRHGAPRLRRHGDGQPLDRQPGAVERGAHAAAAARPRTPRSGRRASQRPAAGLTGRTRSRATTPAGSRRRAP